MYMLLLGAVSGLGTRMIRSDQALSQDVTVFQQKPLSQWWRATGQESPGICLAVWGASLRSRYWHDQIRRLLRASQCCSRKLQKFQVCRSGGEPLDMRRCPLEFLRRCSMKRVIIMPSTEVPAKEAVILGQISTSPAARLSQHMHSISVTIQTYIPIQPHALQAWSFRQQVMHTCRHALLVHAPVLLATECAGFDASAIAESCV